MADRNVDMPEDRQRGVPDEHCMPSPVCVGQVSSPGSKNAAGCLIFVRLWLDSPELALTSLGLALPVVKCAALSPEKADSMETGWTCRIGDVRADLFRIGVFDDFYRMLRRYAEIHERFGSRGVDHLMRVRGAGW
jgi:hypothetical protein